MIRSFCSLGRHFPAAARLDRPAVARSHSLLFRSQTATIKGGYTGTALNIACHAEFADINDVPLSLSYRPFMAAACLALFRTVK